MPNESDELTRRKISVGEAAAEWRRAQKIIELAERNESQGIFAKPGVFEVLKAEAQAAYDHLVLAADQLVTYENVLEGIEPAGQEQEAHPSAPHSTPPWSPSSSS